MLDEWELSPCPVCGEPHTASPIVYSFPQSNYRQCSGCTHVYLSPRLREDAMRAGYEDPSYFEGGAHDVGYSSYTSEGTCAEKTFTARLQCLQAFQPQGRLLDLGCGTGIVLDVADRLGYQAHGLDVSEFAVAEKKAHYGDRVRVGTLHEAAYADGSFDIITMFDVIEHIYDLPAFVKELHRVTSSGGIIAIATPNYNSLMRRVLGRRCVSFKIPEHVSYFTPKTLEKALSSYFSPLEVIATGQHCTLDFLADRIGGLATPLKIATTALRKQLDLKSRSVFIYSGSLFGIFRRL